jgi:ADP-ribose pyrophosphatase
MHHSDDDAIELIGRERVYDGYFAIDRHRLRHRRYDGTWTGEFTREVIVRGDAAAILLYDPERDAVVLIEQFRLPALLAGFPAWQIEIVAGIVDPGETPAEVAIREAHEEAEATILGDLVPIHCCLPNSGSRSQRVDLYCGRVDAGAAGGVHGLAEEHEDIRVLVKSFAEAMALVASGTIVNGFAQLSLYWLAAHRDELRRRWLGTI